MFVYLLPLLAFTSAQSTVDPSVLIDVFGPPPTQPTVTTSPQFEDITVKPTDKNEFTDKNGQSCKCVPYYLCSAELVGVDANNSTVTGWGELDIRFGEDECQESVERCCTTPKDPTDVDIHKPDPTRLRGCGYRNPKGVDFTIKGGTGTEAEFGEFPWVAALLDNRNQSYVGVGVIVHPQVVMTAAHIAYKFPEPTTLTARAGEWDTQTEKERLPFQQRVVQEIYIHKDFHPRNLRNDVALLRLAQPLELAQHINVVCLPRQDESFDSSRGCVANGWGKDKFGLRGRYAVILKKLELGVVRRARCLELLRRTRLGSAFRLHDSFLCAGGDEGRDTCQGDGGAPLACPIGDDRYKLTGLVSWGIGCGGKDVPAVYANVAGFRQWVDDKMAEWGYDTSGYNV
ncbi:phenoloxidase-activating factor 2-like [Plodia interpunctella]|uniref:phenoloxidase-activating factor 2-like n=1 Tax=Plodia interpunctella TaxID=58824 RepID=UPI00236775E7|nr:phenoloxidase-activating factor 2-like [Plodia interpunctella]XP_053623280.1 phenoloxidase-activating factor 2-like [Plodia interpunctella]XP_053623281.1 phenoloxidase-activating factor 2-like [Plodia interpunctella]